MTEHPEPDPYHALDDIGFISSKDPADQPTAEDFAAINRYIQEQKQRRAAEAARQQESHSQRDAPKEAA